MAPFRIRFADQIVSVFLLLSLAVVFAVLFFLMRKQDLFVKRVPYWTIFQDGSGLRVAAPVKIAGIEVGQILEVSLTKQDRVRVDFEILEKYTDRLVQDQPGVECRGHQRASDEPDPCGTRVQRTGGGLGLGSIIPGGGGLVLAVGNRKNSRIVAGGFVQSAAEEGFLERFEREGTLNKVRDIVSQVDSLLIRLNQDNGPLWRALDNVEKVTAQAQSGKGLLGEVIAPRSPLYRRVEHSLASMQKSMQQVEVATAHIQEVTGGVQQKVVTMQQMIDNLEAFSKDATETGKRLKNFAVEAEKVPPDLRVAIDNLDGRIDDLGLIINGLKKSVPFNFVVPSNAGDE